MADAVVVSLSIARLKRLGQGFEAYVTEQHSLVLTHPWIEQSMEQDKARPPEQRKLWRPVSTYGAAEEAAKRGQLEVANPMAFEDLFPSSLVHDLLDPQACCTVDYTDAKGNVLKHAAFRSLFRCRGDRHEISLHKRGGQWYVAMYLGLDYEVPVGTANLVIRHKGCDADAPRRKPLFVIPVVRDVRDEGEGLRRRV